jgi:threonyl-tRNA synthetase
MVHRVVFGSIERFIAILTEHYAGAFPAWLAPVQVKLLAITDRSNDYIRQIADLFKDSNIRAEIDLRNEKIGFKIREAQMEKVPYMLIIGDKEVETGTVSVRSRSKGSLGTMKLDEFKELLLKEIENKDL